MLDSPDARITRTSRGYLQKVWTDPETGKLHREYVHRLVWEEHNGPIPPGHHVHHIDGNKENNDISNLELRPGGVHVKEHGERSNWSWRRSRR